MFGNVNVDYKPCKSKVQLERAAHYILGKLPEQISEGIVKTAPNLYWGMNCDRDNFSRDVLMTRKLFGKRETRSSNLAFKMSISFSPEDNDKLTYDEVFRIAKEFAEKYFQGYEVLFAVHTDKPHKHVHFLVGNCHTETGRAYRRSQKDLYDMSEFFGEQCQQRGLIHSVREDFYNHDNEHDKETFAERQMKAKGKETFKDELREVILEEIAEPDNRTLQDVVNALMRDYNVECRVKGNTISYRHPNFTDKNGKLASVRGSKLGEKYTVKGIKHELSEKQTARENGVFVKGKPEERGRENQPEINCIISTKAGDSENRNATGTNGTDSGNVTKTGVFIRRECKGGSERRESQSSDSSKCAGFRRTF
ncbi:MAG: relaxase/mobilization nuclease domain-containing protein [Ruminococcus sp.]